MSGMQDYLGNTTASERMGLRTQFNQPFYGSNGIQNYGGVTNTGYVSPEALDALGMDSTLQITPKSFSIPSVSIPSVKESWDMSNAFDSMYGIGNDATNSAIAKGNVDMGPTVENTDWGMNGMGGVALGAGQLGLGLLGYLDNKKTSGLQRDLLQQQYNTNASELAHTQAARKALEQGMGSPNMANVPVYK